MARTIRKFSARTIASISQPGYHSDGAGLYLQVSPTGSKSWIFRFTLHGRSREMGLGGLHSTPLAQARDKAEVCRRQVRDEVDPIWARQGERDAARLTAARSITFQTCAAAYIDAHRLGWRNAKHADQWRNTLETYAFPRLGSLPVQEIDTALVMQVLEPIWRGKTETASRVRGRIEAVLDWATVRGHRKGENPARWRGHLDHLLPERARVQKVEHHAALPFSSMSSFMSTLRLQHGVAARGLEFLILTAARTGEVIVRNGMRSTRSVGSGPCRVRG